MKKLLVFLFVFGLAGIAQAETYQVKTVEVGFEPAKVEDVQVEVVRQQAAEVVDIVSIRDIQAQIVRKRAELDAVADDIATLQEKLTAVESVAAGAKLKAVLKAVAK